MPLPGSVVFVKQTVSPPDQHEKCCSSGGLSLNTKPTVLNDVGILLPGSYLSPHLVSDKTLGERP